MSDFLNTMNLKHQEAIEKANKEVDQKKEIIKNSPYRLKYHFMAPTGWINDPNGLVQYKGEYQLFYQFYPYESKWGPMHWGHAKSTDLVHWEHLPVALAPSESYDFGEVPGHGCFSGSAVVNGEELILIYTGHVDNKEPMQVQCIAASMDGIHFEKYRHNPVIDHYPEEGSPDFRDPKVWNHQWEMVYGGRFKQGGKRESSSLCFNESKGMGIRREWRPKVMVHKVICGSVQICFPFRIGISCLSLLCMGNKMKSRSMSLGKWITKRVYLLSRSRELWIMALIFMLRKPCWMIMDEES